MRFSEHFRLNRSQPELDFVDIDPERDLPLYLDPYAISQQEDIWSQKCHNDLVGFFQTAITAIRDGNTGKARQLLNNLSEPHETFLGQSQSKPQGRGVSGKQAHDLYKALADSEAVRTGLVTELADCELLIEGIGDDKISDITTNVIRRHLIDYTQQQCALHGVDLVGTVTSGRLWDPDTEQWTQGYVRLPVINGRKVLLIPKAAIRWKMALDHQEYYNHFVLNFLRDEELQKPGSRFARVLRSGVRKVFKKDLKEEYPLSKQFLYQFSQQHPEVLKAYKEWKARTAGTSALMDRELEEINEPILARGFIERLSKIPAGNNDAGTYHNLMIGVLEFLVYPNLRNPKKELEIHEGRKRIDIVYLNAARTGFFHRMLSAPVTGALTVPVECKNYSKDPNNPELDQLAGRFSPTRGRFGILVARTFKDRDQFLARCRDTARDGRGYILPLVDSDVTVMLEMVERGQRDQIDNYLEHIFRELQV